MGDDRTNHFGEDIRRWIERERGCVPIKFMDVVPGAGVSTGPPAANGDIIFEKRVPLDGEDAYS